MKRLVVLLLPIVGLVWGLAQAVDKPFETPGRQLEIVDRSIEHHGGEIYSASETRLSLCSKSGCSTMTAITDGWDFDLEVAAPAGEGERRVRITNDTVEKWVDGKPVEVEPAERQSLRDWVMARVYFAFLPYRLNDPSVLKQDLGTETWEGRELRRVRVTFDEGSSTDAEDVFLFWLDPVSGRVEQFAYGFSIGEGGLRFRRGFNYRRIGGILFFDQKNFGVDGSGFSVDEIDSQFVEARMRPVSTIELRDIQVGDRRRAPP